MNSFRFLEITITEIVFWTSHTTLVPKAQKKKSLYVLNKLQPNSDFNRVVIEIILTGDITNWH